MIIFKDIETLKKYQNKYNCKKLLDIYIMYNLEKLKAQQEKQKQKQNKTK